MDAATTQTPLQNDHPRRRSPRPRRRHRALALGALALSLSGSATGATAAAAAAPSATHDVALATVTVPQASTQTNVQTYVNGHRRRRGLAPLTMSTALTNAAQTQANYMARTGVMTHTGAGGTNVGIRVTRAGFRWSTVGENVAYGQTSSSAVVYAWLMSAPHAANMFNPSFTYMGVGIAYGRGVYWWCLILARPG